MGENTVAHLLDSKLRTEDVRLKKSAPFSKMMLNEPVRKGLYAAGFVYPTIIQSAAIPLGKSGMDILVQSKSGTGKTMIFCCIILEAYKPDIPEPQSLVVAPTREIAVQIEDVLNRIGKYAQGFRSVCVIGGLDAAEDRRRLQGAKAIVGTPGRLLHLIQNEVLNTSQIKILVLDEADKMYTHSFRQNLQRIQKALPARQQTIACSATFCDNLDQEVANIMRNPLLISTENRATLLVGVKQFVYELPEFKTSILEMEAKLDGLRYIFGCVAFKQCLIFAGSQSRADSYRNYLEKDGWPCELISGSQDQKTRLEKFRKFREFKTRILLATDLMSRGVDSEYVNLVINMELPQDVITYLHRIGRAGRFGSHGLAISFISSEKDVQLFRKLTGQVGSGMKVLIFPPKQTHSDKKPIKEIRDLWDFSKNEEEAKYYGVFNTEPKNVAPLAVQDTVSLSSGNSENKENQSLAMNIASNQSSIDTNTFRIDSKDSALNLNDLAGVEAEQKQPQLHVVQSQSHHSSSQYLASSNTIDDASSIAADSLRSSQQDISRYQSVLMEKAAIPTLVEFLVDHDSLKQNDSKNKEETRPHKLNIDLFDNYTKEVLNDEQSNTTSVSTTMDGPVLSSQKLAKLKTLLIDKPTPSELTPHIPPVDFYTDFVNFQEGDSSSEEIDKNTFILSVATPSNAHESLEELQYTSVETIESTTTSSAKPEVKHFPSPVHNQPSKTLSTNTPNLVMPTGNQPLKLSIKKTGQIEITSIIARDNSLLNSEENSVTVPSHQQIPGESDSMVSPTNSEPNGNSSAAQDQRCKNLNTNESNIVMPTGIQQPMLPIKKIAQIEIAPTTPRNNSLLNSEENSVTVPSHQQMSAENDFNSERSVDSSGFEERTSASKSSDMGTSEAKCAFVQQKQQQQRQEEQLVSEYDSSSDIESSESKDCEHDRADACEENDSSGSSSEHYFNTDNEAEEECEEEEDVDDIGEELEAELEEEPEINQNSSASYNGTSSANANTFSDESSESSEQSYNESYQAAYNRWVDLYLNQMTLIQDYIKFVAYIKDHKEFPG
uniref:Uncharacterized protein n=1 Tax=Glossina pallidipes TaxID=7398 RepID=A0A1B0ADG6_GLOPL